MYTLYGMRCWNAANHYLYDYCQHWMYRVRRGVDLQYDHQRCFLYRLCHCMRSRKHLSVHGVYRNHKPGLYDL